MTTGTFPAAPIRDDGSAWKLYLILITAYFAAQTLARVIASPSPELDEAEQLIWTQSIELGYGPQPPLYTWLLALWFELTGVSILGLASFKNFLLWLCYVATGAAVRAICGTRAGIVASVSMLWLHTLGWESQRDLTHTVLATTLGSLTFLAFVRMAHKPRPLTATTLGLLAGSAILAKYNALVFVLAMMTATVAVPHLRHRLLWPYGGLSLLGGLMVVAPHAFWVLGHWDTVSQRTLGKMNALAGGPFSIWSGITETVLAVFAFATPWWLAFCLAAIPRRVDRGKPSLVAAKSAFLGNPMQKWSIIYLAFVSCFLIALALIGVTQIKVRWLQPFLFLLPALIVIGVGIDVFGRSWRLFLLASSVLGVIWIAMIVARPIWHAHRGKPDEWNLPLPLVAELLRAHGFDGHGTIISPDQLIAGGLRLQFPSARVALANHPTIQPGSGSVAFVITDHKSSLPIPWTLPRPPQEASFPYLHADPDRLRLNIRFIVLPRQSSEPIR